MWQFPVTGGLVLAIPGQEGLYLLNPSAAFIWAELSQGSSPDRISTRLADAFQISVEVARRDVDSTLDDWTRTALIPPKPTESRFTEPRPVGSGTGASSKNRLQIPAAETIAATYLLNDKHFRITLDSPELESEIAPRLAALRTPDTEPHFTISLTTVEDKIYVRCGNEPISVEPNVSAARAILLQEIVRRTSSLPRKWLSLLHAGACGNGRSCVIFPAASHSGKTTLATVLMLSGLTFYADDSVALENETLKIPVMPFGLPIREGSWPLLAERLPGFKSLPVIERFGQQVRFLYPPVHQTSVPAAAMVFPSYQPGAEFSIQPLNTLQTLIHLKESGFWVEAKPESITVFVNWLESLRCYQMTYAEVDQAGHFITTLLQ